MENKLIHWKTLILTVIIISFLASVIFTVIGIVDYNEKLSERDKWSQIIDECIFNINKEINILSEDNTVLKEYDCYIIQSYNNGDWLDSYIYHVFIDNKEYVYLIYYDCSYKLLAVKEIQNEIIQ